VKFLSLVFFVVVSLVFGSGRAQAEGESVSDPFERFNRASFWFNERLDRNILEPVAKEYRAYVPRTVRDSVGNFFENLGYPIYLAGDLIQLKFDQVGLHSGRFMINSVFGCAGLFDVASEYGMEHHSEDIGTGLGYYGVGEGPYLVLPLLGPSNLRDTFGRVGQYFISPTTYISEVVSPDSSATATAWSLRAVDVVDGRAGLLEATDLGKTSSVDYYLFVRTAYHETRQGIIYDGFPPDDDK